MSDPIPNTTSTKFWTLEADEEQIRVLLENNDVSYRVRSVLALFLPQRKKLVEHYQMISNDGTIISCRKQSYKVSLFKGSIKPTGESEEVSTDVMYTHLMHGKNSVVLNIVQMLTSWRDKDIAFEFFGNMGITILRVEGIEHSSADFDAKKHLGALHKILGKEITHQEYIGFQFRQQMNA